MARKRRRRKPAIVPRLGPPTNLRPAGAHESIKRYNRKKQKAALRKDLESGFFIAAHGVSKSCCGEPIPLEIRWYRPLPYGGKTSTSSL
jgi:hypothetical protein